MGEGPPRPGTDGYPDGTDGYPSVPPTASAPWVRPSAGPATEGEPKTWWSGYESPEAFFEHIEAERAKVQGYMEPRPRRRHVPAPGFPAGDEIAGSEPPRGRQMAVRQVGVKLRAVDYALLTEAARLCGVAPSTLARMLVRRGAQAIVDREGGGGGDGDGDGAEGEGGEGG